MDRHRCHVVQFRHAYSDDESAIRSFCQKNGEGKVDLRPHDVFQEAIQFGHLHVIENCVTGELIGTGAVYPYGGKGRVYIELGTSVIDPSYRGLGIADVSVALRSIYTLLVERAGALCVSELYPNSKASRTVLERSGYVLVDPDEQRRMHAEQVSQDPVLHFELPPSAVPQMADLLLRVLNGKPFVKNGTHTYFEFSEYYMIHTPSMREALFELSCGDLRSIGYAGYEISKLEDDLTARSDLTRLS